jgi:hypothetical protein
MVFCDLGEHEVPIVDTDDDGMRCCPGCDALTD